MAKKKENDNVVNNEIMEHNDIFAAEQVDVTAFTQRVLVQGRFGVY